MNRKTLCFVPVIGWVIVHLSIMPEIWKDKRYRKAHSTASIIVILAGALIGVLIGLLSAFSGIDERILLVVTLTLISISYSFYLFFYVTKAENISKSIDKKIEKENEANYI